MTDLERAKRYINNHMILSQLIETEKEMNNHLKEAFNEDRIPMVKVTIGDAEFIIENGDAISDIVNITEKEIARNRQELEAYKL